ncbi:hypothetical protein G6F37_008693 [Rhizopus arrhizus]|nr:hypothetical protein G6F38_006607 [Rhizopus arrhizus]KAG1155271.1 hypothetical protein G6F37_008693 [Rhizopus arrhizus]
MRLSLIFFGLSSVFMIVSSLPLGSVGLEKRQGAVTGAVDGTAGGAGNTFNNLGGAVRGAVGGAFSLMSSTCY